MRPREIATSSATRRRNEGPASAANLYPRISAGVSNVPTRTLTFRLDCSAVKLDSGCKNSRAFATARLIPTECTFSSTRRDRFNNSPSAATGTTRFVRAVVRKAPRICTDARRIQFTVCATIGTSGYGLRRFTNKLPWPFDCTNI